MKLICESNKLDDYLIELNEVDYSNPIIKRKTDELFNPNQTEIEKAKIAFKFVRDEVSHSLDIQSKRVTCSASEVLNFKEGICYAKSHLLASLLRSQGISTGFCYQRLILFDTPKKRYCIHALNAIFFKSLNKWIRVDARGNKKGIDAQFSFQGLPAILNLLKSPHIDDIFLKILLLEEHFYRCNRSIFQFLLQ